MKTIGGVAWKGAHLFSVSIHQAAQIMQLQGPNALLERARAAKISSKLVWCMYTKQMSFAIQSLVHKNNFFRDPKFSTQKKILSRSKV